MTLEERVANLIPQITKLIEAMPPEKLAAGFSLADDIQPFTLGPRGDRIGHCGDVGIALRRMGYLRFRNWSSLANGGVYPALWYPPAAGAVRKDIRSIQSARGMVKVFERELKNVGSS